MLGSRGCGGGGGGLTPKFQDFTSSGTFTPTSSLISAGGFIQILIVGGGAAGLNCAETLRQSNFTGEIVMISDEKRLPYDRTLLSKVLATGNADKLSLRDSGFYDETDIETHLGYKVQSIDKENKTVSLSDGSNVSYDKLLIATGSSARRVNNEGSNLPGVHYLRDGDDQLVIKEAA